ncbi:MAG: NUDIX hydrolase [Elusimicrobia bacterium]|nr:NUDIX hydrolase [Elusimicrobiota bacterium]
MKNECSSVKTVFESRWMRLLAKTYEDLSSEPFYVVEASDYVSVLAMTPQREIVLVRQFRPAVGKATLELPSGHVDAEESPEGAAGRELGEETGYKAPRLELLGVLEPDTGRLANRMHCYFAENVVRDEGLMTEEESLEVILCSERELIQKIESNQFSHALHLAVLALAKLKGRIP